MLLLRILDTFKRNQMRRRGAYFEVDLLVVVQKLYNALDLQFQVFDQRSRILAIIGPQPIKQVVLIIGTSLEKTMIIIISIVIANARITILILLMVAL
jgi:hypothetical protein